MLYTSILRLCLATILGVAIGFEREIHAKEAGVKTHLLVSMGSCLFMILSIYGFDGLYDKEHSSFDPSRIAAQVVTGIGFLGAGTIIFRKNIIRGLTTAAGLWVTCAIGLACGCGSYSIAITTTVLALVSMFLSNFFLKQYSEIYISITFIADNQDDITVLFDKLKNDDILITNYSMQQIMEDNHHKYSVNIDIKTQKRKQKAEFHYLKKAFEGFRITNIE
ncbi:MAG: MgtC/SapB family protein [Bacteroidales bacterium]